MIYSIFGGNMLHSVTIRVAEVHRALAPSAAAWSCSAHHDVEACASGDVAILSSHTHGPDALDAIWAAALANEVELHRYHAQRAAVMERLFA